jgi:prephenate dehydratase
VRVAYQGVPGAFSHQACRETLPDHEPMAFDSFAEAIAAVQEGRCERAVLPVENSIAGEVTGVTSLLADAELAVVGEHLLPIRLQLMALPGASLDGVRTAESHPVALAQCGAVLRELGLQPVERFDTAGAAREVAASADLTRTAVASQAAADLYGLAVLRPGVEDDVSNRTRFVILAPRGG